MTFSARLDGEKRHLMPCGNVRDRGERDAVYRYSLSERQGGQRDRHVILRGDAKQFSHFSHSELLVHDRAHPLVEDFAQGRADGLHQTRHFAQLSAKNASLERNSFACSSGDSLEVSAKKFSTAASSCR